MDRAIRWPLAFLLMTWAGAASAQAPAAPGAAEEIPLYPGAAPGSEKWDWSERSVTNPAGKPMVQAVVRPVLLHYPAKRGKAVGTAMIVAPGGGYDKTGDELKKAIKSATGTTASSSLVARAPPSVARSHTPGQRAITGA